MASRSNGHSHNLTPLSEFGVPQHNLLENEVMVSHTPGTESSARDFFLGRTSSHSYAHSVDSTLNPDGSFRNRKVPADFSHTRTRPWSIVQHVIKNTSATYGLAQDSLNSIWPDTGGFNDHGAKHVQHVGRAVLKLAKIAGVSPEVTRRALVAAAIHDLGNICSRQRHADVSPQIAEKIFPHLAKDHADWETTQRAVQVHDSGVYKFMMQSEKADSAPHRIELMRREFTTEGLLLLIADKVQIGRKRFNFESNNLVAVEANMHTLVNILFETREVYRDKKGNLVWAIEFTPFVSTKELSSFSRIAKPSKRFPGGLRLRVPTHMRDTFKNGDGRYFKQMEPILWQKLGEVMFRTVEASFALFDDLKSVKIAIFDNGAEGIGRRLNKYEFTPGGFDETVREIEHKHGVNFASLSDLYM